MAMQMQKEAHRTIGPVDYLVVQFPENRFTGEIVPEIKRLEDNGIIRVIDLVFVKKDADGNLESFEIEDLGGEVRADYQAFSGQIEGWLSKDDVEIIGEALPNNSSAGAVLYENTWAVKLKEAFMNAGGELVLQGRAPPELVERAREMIQTSKEGTGGGGH